MSSITPNVDYSPLPLHEEAANAITHGTGLLLVLIGTAIVLETVSFQNPTSELAFSVYALTLIAVYAASVFSHWIQEPQLKYRLRVWDQALIYLLIAGTYTPMICVYLQTGTQVLWLTVVWSLALLGFVSKLWWEHRVNRLAVLNYVLLGWVPAIAMIQLIDMTCLAWMAAGGLSYTAGTYFLKQDRTRAYYHAIWHTLVIMGSGFHFFAIVQFTCV